MARPHAPTVAVEATAPRIHTVDCEAITKLTVAGNAATPNRTMPFNLLRP